MALVTPKSNSKTNAHTRHPSPHSQPSSESSESDPKPFPRDVAACPQLRVHALNHALVLFLCDLALELERRGELAPLFGEVTWHDSPLLDLLRVAHLPQAIEAPREDVAGGWRESHERW